MTDKVQRIHQEIEKRLKCLEEIRLRRELAAAEIGDIACCKYLLSFIDSLQEEPETKFKIGDRIRLKGTTVKGDTIIRIYTSEVGNTYFEFKNSDIASADLDWELLEEPKKCMFTKEEFTEEDRKILCEDCEEECEYAKKEEPVSEDLEIAANEWNAKASFTPFYMALDDNGNPNGVRQDYTTHAESFKAGAEWQKTKLIKDATDVTVHIDSGSYPYIPQIELYDYDKDVPLAKEGDKYKVVLIKWG